MKTTNHQPPTPFLFSLGATFTSEPVRKPIEFWGKQLGTDFHVQFAPYNQLVQTLLDPSSVFGQNTHGVNVLLARLEDLAQFPGESSVLFEKIQTNLQTLLAELRTAPERFSVPVLFCLCPPSPEFTAIPGHREMAKRVCSSIAATLADTSGLHFLDYPDVARWYDVEEPHSAEGARLGHIPYTEEYFAALGTALVRYTHALLAPPYKVIALDCDNTLWQGICGEDGPEGVVLDEPRRALQETMLEQREAGMLLTLASKNNEDDVWDTFRAHPEMPLQRRHLSAARLNWEPKPDNLAALAGQLSLGLDSFVFIDDNPKECAEVQGALPEVLTLALPEPIENTAQFLRHVWALDHPVITEEDRNRNAYYKQEEEFGNEIRQAASLEHFIKSLDLQVDIRQLEPGKLPRTAQLTQRTNQFNFTTRRRSESEIASLVQKKEWNCYTVDVSDRFGHYGLVGLLITKTNGRELNVDTCLLSCRALGRGVEHRIFAWLGMVAGERGIHTVRVPFVSTARNKPARQFLQSISFGGTEDTEDSFVLLLPPGELAGLKWHPLPLLAEDGASSKSEPRRVHHRRAVDYVRIASTLATPEQIVSAMRESVTVPTHETEMTEKERQLAQIWAELLECPSISRMDNFFDLGGHSLLAVLLLLRIKERFGAELSIDDVYSGSLTLSDLATRIEAAQLGDISPDEYAALLAEIEGLSDEEARQLLESEGS